MMKRPSRKENEEDLLRMQEEFLAEKSKNPNLQPAAKIVKVEKAGKKSLFAVKRQEQRNATKQDNQENKEDAIKKIVLGDIVEKSYHTPKEIVVNAAVEAFPKVEPTLLNFKPKPGKSLFALSMDSKNGPTASSANDFQIQKSDEMDISPVKRDLNALYGNASVIVEDVSTSSEIHNENLRLLSQMNEVEILEERRKLLETIDPSLVALLAKRRKDRAATQCESNVSIKVGREGILNTKSTPMDTENSLNDLPESNPAFELLERSSAENWMHFDVVEKDKLAWMRDINLKMAQLKPGEQFEARFDWKGVLLPYSTTETLHAVEEDIEKDERELYLHGDEPHRPGYTLQELFRLARSNITQQRSSAFGAISGILNIYSQGFYDQVLELPISKIFFLLRFGFDDNTPALIEVVSKALAYLFYTESDEILLDFLFDNPALYWQPTLQVIGTDSSDDDDPTSIENLQRQMKKMQMKTTDYGGTGAIKANIDESEEEDKTSMGDFQLAETDLVECFLRTNILQRIYYILHNVRPDNSTVESCLKLLIRLARSNKSVAMQIINNDKLIECLFENFLPGLASVDTTMNSPLYYRYPQHLCLKLVRILIAHSLSIALKFINLNIVDKLQNYLFNREDLRGKLIRVQIEALRVLRCLFLLRVDVGLHKKFLPAFRYMLEWHFNHVIYEMGGPLLIRQHAAALLAAISASSGGAEATTLLGNILFDCCCNWFHKATRMGVKEFSQATLLSGCINAIVWYTRHCDSERLHNFITKYLNNFIQSTGFGEFVATLPTTSILLRQATDRRLVNAALPNVGSILMHRHGPQLIVPQIYAVPLLTALWRLLELRCENEHKVIVDCLIQPHIVEPLAHYLSLLGEGGRLNRYLATNFYAKAEVQLICKLLCFEAFETYFEKPQMLQIVYNFLGCLTAEHIIEIEQLFERVIFNKDYLCGVDAATLNKWRLTCLELVHAHYIIVPPTELTLSLPFMQRPILPSDWPYFQLQHILQNYLENVQQKESNSVFSESEMLRMTFKFVTQLEERNPQLQITTPTEKLMYLMIAFMGPDSYFLDSEMQDILRQHILHFYAQCKDYTFQFDETFEGKCKFENLYALFVDHFQAASYGNELFGSLVLVPLAQKYNNKWRRRVWSDYAAALRFLDCDENLLLGGLRAYLEPTETDESLVRAYAMALNTNSVRPNSIPYKIAKHHVTEYRRHSNK